MSRKIKFRAYDTLNQRWYDWEDGDLDYIDSFAYMNLADNIKIMQFTGLYDKSGKEIYEGDIVVCSEREDVENWLINWDSHNAKWSLCRPRKSEGSDWAVREDGYIYYSYKMFESESGLQVIGNIYQDSHLLKESK